MNELEPVTPTSASAETIRPAEPLAEPVASAESLPAVTVPLQPVVAAEPAPEPVPAAQLQPEPEAEVVPEPQPVAVAVVSVPEPQPQPVVIAVPEQAPLVAAQPETPEPAAAPNQLLGLPLQLLNQLLARLGAAPLQSLADLLPALRIVSLLLVAGIGVKLTAATLGAINDLPLVGRLLELVGLISALNYLARNALRSQKRAELLARILKLKRDLLG